MHVYCSQNCFDIWGTGGASVSIKKCRTALTMSCISYVTLHCLSFYYYYRFLKHNDYLNVLNNSQKHCWPAGRVCTMQYLYSIYLAFSVVFSIFLVLQSITCLFMVCPFLIFNAFNCLKILYGCIILFNIL